MPNVQGSSIFKQRDKVHIFIKFNVKTVLIKEYRGYKLSHFLPAEKN